MGLLVLAVGGASAQGGNLGLVVRDGSIGPVLLPGDDGVVPPGDGASYLITPDLGEESGGNLFHSFQSFSIGEVEIARFTTNGGIDNIISRVTGGDPSNILGQLESTDASIFLLNPYGVFFGENASVDVNGSFHVSTADRLRFESGAPFLTRESSPPVSLSSAPPVSFGFLVDEPAPIGWAGARLCGVTPSCVPEGQDLSFVGGDITIQGRSDISEAIEAPGGEIRIVSVAKAGVEVPIDARTLEVDAYAPGSFGDVLFTDDVVLDVNSGVAVGTGRIVIRGGRFVMEGGSLNAGNRGGADGFQNAIDVEVTGEIEMRASATGRPPRMQSTATGTGRSGDIRIRGDRFRMSQGARIANQARDSPNGANIIIDANTIEIIGTGPGGNPQTSIFARARGAIGTGGGSIFLSGEDPGIADRADHVSIDQAAQLFADSDQDAASGRIGIAAQSLTIDGSAEIFAIPTRDSTAGAIDIDAGETLIAGGASLSTLTGGQNPGADIEFTGDRLTVTDGGKIATILRSGSTGNGGDVNITVSNILVTESGSITTENLGGGIGGAITIVADEAVTVSNGGQITTTISSTATPEPTVRRGGDITIQTGQLTVSDHGAPAVVAQISTSTSAEGQAGSDTGKGGDLTINAERIGLIDGGQLRAVTLAGAPAGDLRIVAHGSDGAPGVISIAGRADVSDPFEGSIVAPSGIFTTSGLGAASSATGDGGNLSIEADIVEVTNGGEIASSTFGSGKAGSVTLIASERVTVRGSDLGASLIAAQGDVGDGGDIDITTGLLELIDGGELSSSGLSTGNPGNVNIAADQIIIQGVNPQTTSGIFAQSVSGTITAGDTGAIQITTGDLTVADGGQISTRTFGGGDAGHIRVVAGNNIEVSNGGEISAESQLLSFVAGAAGDIDLRADQSIQISNGRVSNRTAGGRGGSIRLSAQDITIGDQGLVSSRGDGTGDAGNILFEDASSLTIESESVVTAETTGSGDGGKITIRNVDDVLLTGESEVTTKSTGFEGGGNAGSIAIAANDTLQIDQHSEITATAADAGGGRISLQAGKLVYVLDSEVKTDINLAGDGRPDADAAGIAITFLGDENVDVAPTTPEFVVINRSTVQASASGGGAGGNLSINGDNVFISSDSVIEATGQITGNLGFDTDFLNEVTPLQVKFVDPSDRLLPPCSARNGHTGSFIVQNRAAAPLSPDSPLSAGLGTGDAIVLPSDSVGCPLFETEIQRP